MTAVLDEAALCECSLWELADPEKVRFCEEHHSYWRGSKRLLSVTHVLRAVWPFKPDFSAAPPHVLENARERGVVVDRLFTAYLRGRLAEIPPNTREDAVELFFRLKHWWDERKHEDVQAQVILADDSIAGMCDVLADDWIYDVKATSEVEPMYHIQLGLYAQLHYTTFGRPAKGIGIIHVNKKLAKPKLIKLDLMECAKDAMTIRDCYFMAARRTGK